MVGKSEFYFDKILVQVSILITCTHEQMLTARQQILLALLFKKQTKKKSKTKTKEYIKKYSPKNLKVNLQIKNLQPGQSKNEANSYLPSIWSQIR